MCQDIKWMNWWSGIKDMIEFMVVFGMLASEIQTYKATRNS